MEEDNRYFAIFMIYKLGETSYNPTVYIETQNNEFVSISESIVILTENLQKYKLKEEIITMGVNNIFEFKNKKDFLEAQN